MHTARLHQTVELGKDAAWNTLSFPLLVPISLSVYLPIYICGSQIKSCWSICKLILWRIFMTYKTWKIIWQFIGINLMYYPMVYSKIITQTPKMSLELNLHLIFKIFNSRLLTYWLKIASIKIVSLLLKIKNETMSSVTSSSYFLKVEYKILV